MATTPETYSYKDDIGDNCEMKLGAEEQAFIKWAESEGYKKHDAVLVMGGDGMDVPIALYDAWEPFHAGFEAAAK